GLTTDFANDSVQAVFTMFFGSYFGDWDTEDNFLRAPLASKGLPLASAWSGRPHWDFYHMALGESIGYSTWITQNDYGNYFRTLIPGNPAIVTAALMGDPTLRLHPIAPAGVVTVENFSEAEVHVNWTTSADTGIAGYYVYRASSMGLPFNRISDDIITGTHFSDPGGLLGHNVYMVRAVKLEITPSGSYYNLSPGIFDTITLAVGIEDKQPGSAPASIYPNPTTGILTISLSGTGTAQITVIDVLGNEVGSSYSVNQKSLTLDINGLSSGIYFIKVMQDGNVSVARIIKE
nr:T9SS type A sorting domain-containing protein [Bacteroidota bacterium]